MLTGCVYSSWPRNYLLSIMYIFYNHRLYRIYVYMCKLVTTMGRYEPICEGPFQQFNQQKITKILYSYRLYIFYNDMLYQIQVYICKRQQQYETNLQTLTSRNISNSLVREILQLLTGCVYSNWRRYYLAVSMRIKHFQYCIYFIIAGCPKLRSTCVQYF